MDISSVLAAVGRRWYVALIVVAFAGYAAYGVWETSRPLYSATTTLTVLPTPSLLAVRAASDAGESSLANPFGIQATGLLGSLLVDQINNGAVVLPSSGGQSSVSAAPDLQDSRAFFEVTAQGTTPEAVAEGLSAVADQSPNLLADIQVSAGSPADQLYTALRVRNDVNVSVDYPDRLRGTLGFVLGGLVLAALLSVVVDSLVRAWRERRFRATRSAADPVRDGGEHQEDESQAADAAGYSSDGRPAEAPRHLEP